ncbi:hypothetical protein BTR22_06890 [Alkalihalophilus pseudofirmus]|uniref:opine metallophore biosynthesis dehydrogenase n=1 Tax=Alkalihalophilus pseudofirmus TaxID=79885 RepID=UPI000951FDE8|nr:hypothetical protein BTR22_06890 [Alkalihalophilus pseudofirmus]
MNTHAIKKVLLAGMGPAAAQIAVLLTNSGVEQVDVVSRTKLKSREITAKITKSEFPMLQGKASISELNTEMTRLNDDWDTIIYCTPNSAYADLTRKLNECDCPHLKRIILLSPGIGDNALVKRLLHKKADVISLSTYFAATKWQDYEMLTTITKNVKKKIYLGSSEGKVSDSILMLKKIFTQAGIHAEVTENALTSESRSITTYVHPPFFMNSFALNEIFFGSGPYKSMYKVYPEGPLTPQVTKDMVLLWKEITELLRTFGVNPLELIRFLNDDNYPVPEYLLPRELIDGFMTMSQKEQEYALFVRYTGLLIDPFSSPDQNGHYLDFSRVPLNRIFKQGEDWIIPRIPLEDYMKVKRLVMLGEALEMDMPTAQRLTQTFEEYVSQAKLKNISTIDLEHMYNQLNQETALIYQHLHQRGIGV